jgi:hypothetical protein
MAAPKGMYRTVATASKARTMAMMGARDITGSPRLAVVVERLTRMKFAGFKVYPRTAISKS